VILPEEWKVLADKLRLRREEKGLSVLQVSLLTNVSPSKLRKMEEGDFVNVDADVYVRNYLRRLSGVLELPYEELLSLYEEGKKKCMPQSKMCEERANKKARREIVMVVLLGIVSFLAVFLAIECVRLRESFPAVLVTEEPVLLNGKEVVGTVGLKQGKYIVEGGRNVIIKTLSEEWHVNLSRFEVTVTWEK